MPSSLTVQDVLREATFGSGSAASAPLDEQIKRFRKSFWEHENDPAPSTMPTFRRIGNRWGPQLDIALGFGALAAVLLIVAVVLVHTFLQSGKGSRPDIVSPVQIPDTASSLQNMQAQVSKLSDAFLLPKRQAAKELTSATLVPSTVGGWQLWKGDGVNTNDSRVAFYQQGSKVVELTLIRTPQLEPTFRHPLQVCAGSFRTVATPQGAAHIQPREATRYGRDCLFFDYTPRGQTWRIFTANTYLPPSPHTVSWYSAPYVITAGADTGAARDAFVQSYLAAKN